MGQLGLPELIIIGIIALLIFGPKKLPELGKGLGESIRSFKQAFTESKEGEVVVKDKENSQDKQH